MGRRCGSIRWLAAAVFAAPVLGGCTEAPEPERSTAHGELSAAALRSATYRSPHVAEGEVTLDEGVYRDTARRVAVFFQPEYAAGDLDGDGAPLSQATFFLGDRVPAERVRIENGVILIDLTMHGPADPMCCPTVRTTRRFRLEGGEIREIADSPGS